MSRTHRAERWIMIVTLLGAIGCATVAFWPRPTPTQVLAARLLQSIGADERRAITAFEHIYRDLQHGTSHASAAERIDRHVLPPWHSAQSKAKAAAKGPLGAYIPSYLTEYFRQREIAWLAMSKALRDDDRRQALRFREAWEAANKLAAKINANQNHRRGAGSE